MKWELTSIQLTNRPEAFYTKQMVKNYFLPEGGDSSLVVILTSGERIVTNQTFIIKEKETIE